MRVEWDRKKNETNKTKHGIDLKRHNWCSMILAA
jgi:uncharacterized DUF497 family protein